MRSALFILSCFFIVILLYNIPNKTIEDEGIVTHPQGMLPGLFTFSIICMLILLTAAVWTLFKLKENLQGHFTIKRTDLNLDQQLYVIIFWITFILISRLLSDNHFFFSIGLTPYFIIILATFSVYLLLIKWYIKKSKLDFISIDEGYIYLKGLWGKGKREMKNLKALNYNSKNNSLTLQFKEGLEDIRMHLADYNLTEVKKIIEVIKHAKGDTILYNENLNILFAKDHS